ncbi:MAG: hypothetical protein QXK12_00430 [Candidatus Nezhaarchaeales archaeon]
MDDEAPPRRLHPYRKGLVKAQEEVGVIIRPPTAEGGYTSTSVHYGSYKPPSKDLVAGEEPIDTCPKSVMLRHSSITIGGVKR